MLTYGKWAHDAVGIMILLTHAAQTEEPAVRGPELARRLGMGSALVAKQLRQLGRAGLVTARRGFRGGYRLARPAHSISLLDVVKVFSMDRNPEIDCRHCQSSSVCPVHASLQAVNKMSCDRLGAVTLQQCAQSMRQAQCRPLLSCLEPGQELC